MANKTIYISDEDAPIYERADARAKVEGKSLSAAITELLRDWLAEADHGGTQLFWSEALPDHYVAIKPDGSRWVIVCSPISAEVWAEAKPYKGNASLERVRPKAIERFYQPAK